MKRRLSDPEPSLPAKGVGRSNLRPDTPAPAGDQDLGPPSSLGQSQALSYPAAAPLGAMPTPDDVDALRKAYRRLENRYAQSLHRLEQAETHSQSLFRLSPDAVLIVRQSDGRILDVNPSFVELSGYTREEAIGNTTLELGLWEDREVRRRLREMLAAKGSVQNFEARFILKNGRRTNTLVSAETLPPASSGRLLVVIRDIDPILTTKNIVSGQREALRLQNDWLQRVQKDLSASRQQYQDLFESAPVGYCTLNRKGVILAINHTGADMLAASGDMLCGTHLSHLVADGYQQVVTDHLERVFSLEDQVESEVKLKTMGASPRYLRLISHAVPDENNSLGYCRTAFLDSTERRRAKASLSIANRFLAIANLGEGVDPTLRAFLDEMKRSTDCQALGIRMLADDGSLPLTLSTGFPGTFETMVRRFCSRSRACLCSQVISQGTDPGQAFFTAHGAFFSPRLTQINPQIQGMKGFETRCACTQLGFQTLAIIPIRAGDAVLGLVILADTRPEALDLHQVRLLENAALQLGNSIRRVRVEEALRHSHDALEERVAARTAEVVEANRHLQDQIARRERAEKGLRQSREMLQQVFDGISDPLVLTDAKMQIQMVNRAARDYYGLADTTDFANLKCPSARPQGGDACASCPIPDAVANARPTNFERRGYMDSTRMEKVVIYPLLATRGNRRGAVIRIQDITVEKAMERQLIQSEKLASLGTLVSSVAHEINNPNSFISFNIPILREYLNELLPMADVHAASQRDPQLFNMPYAEFRNDLLRLIDNIEHGSQRINAFLGNLREFSAARPTLALKSVALPAVVEKALALVNTKVRHTIKTVAVDIPAELPLVYTDESALEQILVNLLVNAAQAADKPAAWVRLRARPGETADSGVKLEVADNGCGMSAVVQAKIFDPFYSTKINEGGTGLGLYVCRKLIRQLGGHLGLESTVGEGSRFTVTLPTAESLLEE
jgi:PAS domain S-box-containing protein